MTYNLTWYLSWGSKLDNRYIRPYFTDLSRDHFAQVVRRVSQHKDGADFMLLKDMNNNGNKDEESGLHQREASFGSPTTGGRPVTGVVKSAPSEDVILEAVSLN